jgi:proteasome assembly chaperone (PAC2) family protein
MPQSLKVYDRPRLNHPRMVLGLSGWMDGGEVSTGTVAHLVSAGRAARFAEVLPEGFYIYSFPGPMELQGLLRPDTVIEAGLVTSYETPTNVFYADPANNLVLFKGREPNLNWECYAECLFSLAQDLAVSTVYLVGSCAGVVPHTRDPRLYGSVSDAALKKDLEGHGIRFSSYRGPAGISTLLTKRAGERGLRMVTLVAEIPAYIQGANPRCIEAVLRRLTAILAVRADLDGLRASSDAFEAKVNNSLQKHAELAEMVRKMEAEYDNELFDSEMSDLKEWLEKQGIRLD